MRTGAAPKKDASRRHASVLGLVRIPEAVSVVTSEVASSADLACFKRLRTAMHLGYEYDQGIARNVGDGRSNCNDSRRDEKGFD